MLICIQKDSKFNIKVLDKTPIGICYTLIMTYQQHNAHWEDVLLISMHIP